MPLRFKYRDLWYNGKLRPNLVYAQLEDLQEQIDELKGTSSSSKSASNTSESKEE